MVARLLIVIFGILLVRVVSVTRLQSLACVVQMVMVSFSSSLVKLHGI